MAEIKMKYLLFYPLTITRKLGGFITKTKYLSPVLLDDRCSSDEMKLRPPECRLLSANFKRDKAGVKAA